MAQSEGPSQLRRIWLQPPGNWDRVWVAAAPEETAELRGRAEWVIPQGPFRVKVLLCRVEITGGREPREQIVMARRPGGLDTLQSVGVYLKRVAAPEGSVDRLQQRILAAWDQPDGIEGCSFQGSGGPRINAWTAQSVLDINEAITGLPFHDGGFSVSYDELRHLLDLAYTVGREVREAQFPADVARTRGLQTGANLSAAAEAWRLPFLEWLQLEIDAANAAAASPLSLDKVIDLAYRNWPGEGFGRQKVPPERSTLKAALSWGEREGQFRRPSAKRGRKKGPAQLS